jgi:hypothetical protein
MSFAKLNIRCGGAPETAGVKWITSHTEKTKRGGNKHEDIINNACAHRITMLSYASIGRRCNAR